MNNAHIPNSNRSTRIACPRYTVVHVLSMTYIPRNPTDPHGLSAFWPGLVAPLYAHCPIDMLPGVRKADLTVARRKILGRVDGTGEDPSVIPPLGTSERNSSKQYHYSVPKHKHCFHLILKSGTTNQQRRLIKRRFVSPRYFID